VTANAVPARQIVNPGALRALWLMALTVALIIAQSIAAQARPESFADLAEKVSPAVVNITTSTVVAQGTGPSPIVPEGSPFEDFFREFRDRNGQGDRPRRTSALGSGFVISEDGFVVTNNHVIESADEIIIEFYSGEELTAEVIGTDPKTDIALLKVEPDEPLPFVNFGDSDIARVGDWVVAMGNPRPEVATFHFGKLSAGSSASVGSCTVAVGTSSAGSSQAVSANVSAAAISVVFHMPGF